jgi:hypothetical protein
LDVTGSYFGASSRWVLILITAFCAFMCNKFYVF